MSDASDMLAAALEQMDGIIAGNVHPLKDEIMPFTLLSSLFHYNSFITFLFSYFHLLSLFNDFRLVPCSIIFVPLLHFLPKLFLNFILKCQKF